MAEGLAEILLVYRAVFITLLDSFSKLSQVKANSTIFKTWSESPYSTVFSFNNTILLKVGNCLISFLRTFIKSFNFGAVV